MKIFRLTYLGVKAGLEEGMTSCHEIFKNISTSTQSAKQIVKRAI